MAQEYNPGHLHEALHTTWVLMETFESFVIDSPGCQRFQDAIKQAEKVHRAMFDLYQLLGRKEFDEEKASEAPNG